MTPSWRLPRPHPGILPLSTMRLLPVAIVLLLSSSTIPAQNAPNTAQNPLNTSADVLHDYESCTFDDGSDCEDRFASAWPSATHHQHHPGPKVIQMPAGRRIMFAHGVGGDFLPT